MKGTANEAYSNLQGANKDCPDGNEELKIYFWKVFPK